MDATSIIIYVMVAFLVIGSAVVVMRRRSAASARDPEILYFRCPGCGRKLKYTAKQAGNRGGCSNCKEPLTFPGIKK